MALITRPNGTISAADHRRLFGWGRSAGYLMGYGRSGGRRRRRRSMSRRGRRRCPPRNSKGRFMRRGSSRRRRSSSRRRPRRRRSRRYGRRRRYGRGLLYGAGKTAYDPLLETDSAQLIRHDDGEGLLGPTNAPYLAAEAQREYDDFKDDDFSEDSE